jgi:GNAT superfamily N-acetyltransferase
MIRGRMTSDLQIVPFADEHLDAAATLLAGQQRRLRELRPELPQPYTRADACRPLIAAVLERQGAHGVVAIRNDEVAGYLVGFPRTEPVWGRGAWSPIEGGALAADLDAERVRDLYAAWAQHFVLRGYFRQYVHAPVDDPELMAAWVRTGFGQMQAHAVRDLDLEPGGPPPSVRVRQALPEDIDALDPLLPLIARQLLKPPAFAIRLPEEIPTYRDSWLEELAEPGAHHLLAEEDGRALAMASFYDAEPGPMVPTGAWELSVAMTLPDARGRGLMRQLLGAGFAAARANGASHCVTDWRSASLPTHRSWTALGFRPTHYRLHRHVDERIAWATG